MNVTKDIAQGRCCLGIELGSTRIKAVLIGSDHSPVASGEHGWENRLEDGIWSYRMEDVWTGLQRAYAKLRGNVSAQYGVELTSMAAMGFSAMMHGYVALDKNGELLIPFRTWRNTITGQAAKVLTEHFQFNIPQRWSIAHLYQAILNGEAHVKDIRCLTTLAGYVHYKLTGCRAIGVGEASGMFPIDSRTGDYDQTMTDAFEALIAEKHYPWKLREILPQVLHAGQSAGTLTPEGARLLDPTGLLSPGIPLAPPEGDAGTGMVATNTVIPRTGNVSAGTSVFAMIVLEKPLSKVYSEIDLVTTPSGQPVAMVHCNNCTNEINAWAQVFKGFLEALGQTPDMNTVFSAMFHSALAGREDAGGLTLYNYLSGEPITGLMEGCPLLVRTPLAQLDFPNFMRAQLYSALATLKIGMDILSEEHVAVNRLLGHGGFFKTPKVGQRIMAAATATRVSVMETAGEGGPWGMALLAAYLVEKKSGQSLEDYLDNQVFAGQTVVTLEPRQQDVEGFNRFMRQYRSGLAVERQAVESLKANTHRLPALL
ncbi:xylulokinase [Anaerotruncus colihominis]|uniref:xylulokinase n=1 Tax=Anaerotruncus colihominis TaxID=169435 RepID=UPI0026EFEE65|nr:FGGY-family carbohydrate kinase [Anaerotruncus colihominis]